VKKIEEVNVLVVGDVMLDTYIVGEVKRISPEAPVPVVRITDEYSSLGGCGNVVRNLRSIGAQVSCLSYLGKDEIGENIKKEMNTIGCNFIPLFPKYFNSIQKTRVLSEQGKTQMLRIDKELTKKEVEMEPLVLLRDAFMDYDKFKNCDLIIISDYDKGTVSFEMMNFIRELQIPFIVDPKPSNLIYFRGAFLITPNESEWEDIKKIIRNSTRIVENILITKGKKGMTLYEPMSNRQTDIPADEVNVFNVTGAGDTVIAVIGACIARGINLLSSCKIANSCAQYVVTQPGTASITRELYDEKVLNEVIGEHL